MSDKTKHSLSKFRTFAGDLETARHGRTGDKPAPEQPIEQHKAASKDIPAPAVKKSEKKKKTTVLKTPVVKAKLEHIVMPTAATKSKPTEPKPSRTKIPAFHEIQKQAKAIETNITVPTKEKSKKDSPKEKSADRTHRPNIGYDATIITDTQADRFKFFPSVVTSVKSWFKKLTTRKKKNKTPKYEVPETSRRKGVIQKATSKSGAIFTADSETLRERIRRRQRESKAEPAEDDVMETTWSPYTEAGYSLLEAPESDRPDVTQNVQVAFKKHQTKPSKEITFTTPSVPIPAPTPEIEPEPVEVTQPEPAPTPEIESADQVSTIPAPADTPEPLPVITEEELAAEAELYAAEVEAAELDAETSPTNTDQTNSNFLNRFDTNTLTLLLLIMVVGSVMIIFVSRIVLQQLSTPPEIITETTSEAVLKNSELTVVTVTTDQLNSLPKLLTDTVAASPGNLVEMPVFSPTGDEVNAPYIFATLDFETLPTFHQSITALRFVSVNQSAPAIVFQFVDEDTVRGGLLHWESNMVADLETFYNISAPIGYKFTDDTVAGFDARMLKVNDEVVLIYGIVGQNTAIISNDQTTFTQIVEQGMNP